PAIPRQPVTLSRVAGGPSGDSGTRSTITYGIAVACMSQVWARIRPVGDSAQSTLHPSSDRGLARPLWPGKAGPFTPPRVASRGLSVDRAVAGRELAQQVADVAERALQPDHRIAGLEQLLARVGVHHQRGGDRVGARARGIERP